MRLVLRSEQFTVDAEESLLVSNLEDATADSAQIEPPCRKSVIAGIRTLPSGPIILSLFKCVVEFKRTRPERRLRVICVRGVPVIDTSDPEVARIDLPPYSLLRVVWLDEDGLIRRDGGFIGVATADGTFEAPVNGDGYVDFFVPPGPVSAYACSQTGTNSADACLEMEPEIAGASCPPRAAAGRHVTIGVDGTREDLGTIYVHAPRSTA